MIPARMRLVLSIGFAALGAIPASAQRQREVATLPVTVNTVSPGLVRVAWQAVQKGVAYDAERCEGAGLTTCSAKGHLTSSQPLQFDDNLTAAGTYLYRVTALGPNALPIAQGQVGYQYNPPTAVLMPPPGGTVLVTTPAGPDRLTASSPVPGQILLSWSLVPAAVGYHVIRSIVGGETGRELPAPVNSPYGNNAYHYIDAPVDFRWTYSYQVYAMIPSGTTQIQSGFSPMATLKSLPFVQVSGLAYTLAPSTQIPGRLDLTVRWNPVDGAEKYRVWDNTFNSLLGEPQGAVYIERSVSTKMRFTVCVGTVYPYGIRQPSTEPCIDVKT